MTDVNKNSLDLIHCEQDALKLYAPPPRHHTGGIGLEVEMPLYRPNASGGMDIPPPQTLTRMQSDLKAQGYDAQLEAAGVLEYASRPVPIARVADLIAAAQEDVARFKDRARQDGYTRAEMCILPTTTRRQALDNLVPRERLQAALKAITETMHPLVLNVPLLTTGTQVSFAPEDMAQLHRMLTRAYILTPLIMAAMNSHSGYAGGEAQRQDVHLRGEYYAYHGSRGGIAESVLLAENSEDFTRRHIRSIFDSPMLFAYGPEGKLITPSPGQVLTFRSLIERGLNTRSNYELAESFQYHDVKVCNLRDADGQVVGKRLEVRACDSGPHQAASLLLLTAALIPDGPGAVALEKLLHDYGFTGQLRRDASLLLQARQAAVYHEGKFMDIAFGQDPKTGAKRSMRDFAADVAGVLCDCYADQPAVQKHLSHLVDILLTGDCDAKKTKQRCPTYADMVAELRQKAHIATPQNPQNNLKYQA
jgi:hypothetical protein